MSLPDPSTASIERIILQTPLIKIGTLRCAVDHASFRHPGPTENYVLVFARSCVYVRRADGAKFVSDPSVVAFWNRNLDYFRDPLSPEGAQSDWYAIDHGVVLDAVRSIDPAVEATPDRPFRFSHAPLDARTYLLQRQMLRLVLEGGVRQSLEIEEATLQMLRRLMDRAYRHWGRKTISYESMKGSLQEEIVERAEAVIAARFREPLSVSDIARQAGASAFHLCRLFRQHRKTTLHARCNRVRLRTALAYVLDTQMDLSELAFDLGYSSHSHFTWAFRREFGLTPSALRGEDKNKAIF